MKAQVSMVVALLIMLGVSSRGQATAPDAKVTVFAAGDVMLSRGVAHWIDEYGPDYPYAKMEGEIREADWAFANLECALTKGPAHQRGEMRFRGDPAQAEALRVAGFDALVLANNHSPNFGVRGLRSTFAALKEAKVAWVGAGIDERAAAAPLVAEIHGVRIALLAYNAADVVPTWYFAGAKRAGTNRMNIAAMQGEVAKARALADLVIVSMHAGDEYRQRPNARQVAFAHAAIVAGADLVVGHHPHVVQPEELYRGKPIFYSLGNFIFDQSKPVATEDGVALRITVERIGGVMQPLRIVPLPVHLQRGQPTPATGVAAERILARLQGPRGQGKPRV